MARRVKCRICGKYGTNETFYKVTDENGKSKYYCNQEEYENHINEKRKRDNLIEYIHNEILLLEEGQIINPIMIKKLNELHKFYDWEVIHKTFEKCKDSIHYWIENKNFSSEYGMISYIMKIIESHINDVYNEWKFKKEQERKIESNEIDLGLLNDLEIVNCVKDEDDNILEFLNEDDL